MEQVPTSPTITTVTPQSQKMPFSKKIIGIIHRFSSFSSRGASNVNNYTYANSQSSRLQSVKRSFKKNKYFYIPLIIFVLGIGLIFYKSLNSSGASSKTILGSDDNRVDIQKPKAQEVLGREFLFPLRGTDGKEVSKLKFKIENAELRDQIIVKGKRATSVKGRTFLILNIKITNNYNSSIQINSRDYVRLTVNNGTEKFAPDIHNDPVEVQAISTKQTRVGFPINDTDKNLTLYVGEIKGAKEAIKFNLQ